MTKSCTIIIIIIIITVWWYGIVVLVHYYESRPNTLGGKMYVIGWSHDTRTRRLG
jgi:hypothetical protein